MSRGWGILVAVLCEDVVLAERNDRHLGTADHASPHKFEILDNPRKETILAITFWLVEVGGHCSYFANL